MKTAICHQVCSIFNFFNQIEILFKHLILLCVYFFRTCLSFFVIVINKPVFVHLSIVSLVIIQEQLKLYLVCNTFTWVK